MTVSSSPRNRRYWNSISVRNLIAITSFLLSCGSSNHVLSFSIPSKSTIITSRSANAKSLPFFANNVDNNESSENGSSSNNNNNNNKKTNVIAGASGYIGKSTVRESVRQGYNTIALVRDKSKITSSEGKMMYGQFFEGATVVECDVCDPDALTQVRTLRNPIFVLQTVKQTVHVCI